MRTENFNECFKYLDDGKEWREFPALDEIAHSIGNTVVGLTLSTCDAIYKGNELIIIAHLNTDRVTLEANMNEIFDAVRKCGFEDKILSIKTTCIRRQRNEQTFGFSEKPF